MNFPILFIYCSYIAFRIDFEHIITQRAWNPKNRGNANLQSIRCFFFIREILRIKINIPIILIHSPFCRFQFHSKLCHLDIQIPDSSGSAICRQFHHCFSICYYVASIHFSSFHNLFLLSFIHIRIHHVKNVFINIT